MTGKVFHVDIDPEGRGTHTVAIRPKPRLVSVGDVSEHRYDMVPITITVSMGDPEGGHIPRGSDSAYELDDLLVQLERLEEHFGLAADPHVRPCERLERIAAKVGAKP